MIITEQHGNSFSVQAAGDGSHAAAARRLYTRLAPTLPLAERVQKAKEVQQKYANFATRLMRSCTDEQLVEIITGSLLGRQAEVPRLLMEAGLLERLPADAIAQLLSTQCKLGNDVELIEKIIAVHGCTEQVTEQVVLGEVLPKALRDYKHATSGQEVDSAATTILIDYLLPKCSLEGFGKALQQAIKKSGETALTNTLLEDNAMTRLVEKDLKDILQCAVLVGRVGIVEKLMRNPRIQAVLSSNFTLADIRISACEAARKDRKMGDAILKAWVTAARVDKQLFAPVKDIILGGSDTESGAPEVLLPISFDAVRKLATAGIQQNAQLKQLNKQDARKYALADSDWLLIKAWQSKMKRHEQNKRKKREWEAKPGTTSATSQTKRSKIREFSDEIARDLEPWGTGDGGEEDGDEEEDDE